MKQCGCCLLPFRGKATRALVIGERPRSRGEGLERISRFANVCPRCAARGTLTVAIPPDVGQRRGRPVELPFATINPLQPPGSIEHELGAGDSLEDLFGKERA